jgi:hypothetical protein
MMTTLYAILVLVFILYVSLIWYVTSRTREEKDLQCRLDRIERCLGDELLYMGGGRPASARLTVATAIMLIKKKLRITFEKLEDQEINGWISKDISKNKEENA